MDPSQSDQSNQSLLPFVILGEQLPFNPYSETTAFQTNTDTKITPRSAHRLISSWICLLATTCFVVLTVLYASQVPVTAKIGFVFNSSSHTIFVLSLLSGLSGLLLTALIALTFENLQWLLVSRENGLRATSFLALLPGTGLFGLLVLIFGRGQNPHSRARIWGALKITAIMVPPILGVLIMSKCDRVATGFFRLTIQAM